MTCYCVGSRASYANSMWLLLIEPRVQHHISWVTKAIALKLSEGWKYNAKRKYLECEVVRYCVQRSPAMLYNSHYCHSFSLMRPMLQHAQTVTLTTQTVWPHMTDHTCTCKRAILDIPSKRTVDDFVNEPFSAAILLSYDVLQSR